MEYSTQTKELVKKIKALMAVRLVLVTLVLVTGSFALEVQKLPFYSIIAIFYIATIIYAILLKTDFPLYLHAYIQIITDTILETVIIHYAGGANSVYAFLYAPSIITAGVVISSNAAKTIAGLSSIFYGAVSGLEYFGVIPPVPSAEELYKTGIFEVLFIVSFRIIVFCLLGYLSSYLSRELLKGSKEIVKLRNFADIILKNISSGVITLDSSGKVVYANPPAFRILRRGNLLNIYWHNLFWKEFDKERVEQFILNAKSSSGAEIDIMRPDGERLVINCSYSDLYSGEDNIMGGVLTFVDLTPLKEQYRDKYKFENIIGKSTSMQKVYELMEKVAQTDSTVLIYGESGTGKELVARAIHHYSPRKNKSFVAINCGGLPEGLLESELFGHVRGSFTGAVSDKVGLFQVADGGTIFLDEISATSPTIQVKLLRVLQEKEIKKVGDTKDIPVDVRVIAATNKRMDEEVKKGVFREDLYYRLSVIPIHLPALRERVEDIPLLSQHFLEKYSGPGKNNLKTLGPGVMDIFLSYSWPGNVRELENVIERAVTLCEGIIILQRDLPQELLKVLGKGESGSSISLKNFIRQKEREYIHIILKQTSGDKKEAANILGIDLATLYRKLQE